VVVLDHRAVAVGVAPDERVLGGEVLAGLGEDRLREFLERPGRRVL